MFKRFKVIKLFHQNDPYRDVKSWVKCEEEMPKCNNGIFLIRNKYNHEMSAFYCDDQCFKIHIKVKRSYWWDINNGEPLYDIVEWGKFESQG